MTHDLIDSLVERIAELAADRVVRLVRERLQAPTAPEQAPAARLNGQRWLDTKAAATYIGVRANTMEIWRVNGRGPHYEKLGTRRVRYDVRKLDEFLASSERRHTGVRGRPPRGKQT